MAGSWRSGIAHTLCIVWMLAALSVMLASAAEADFVVTNDNDSGPGSLRQAILNANAAGAPNGVPNGTTSTIVINPGIGTIALTSGPLPLIYSNLNIEGAAGGSVLNGSNTYRGLFVSGLATTGNGAPSAVTVSVSNLTIQNVVAQGGAGGASGSGGGGGLGAGGGLFVNQNANVTITNVSFGNSAARGGAGGANNGTGASGGGGGLGGAGGAASASSGGGGGLFFAGGGSAGTTTRGLFAGGGGGGGITSAGANGTASGPSTSGGNGGAGASSANIGGGGGGIANGTDSGGPGISGAAGGTGASAGTTTVGGSTTLGGKGGFGGGGGGSIGPVAGGSAGFGGGGGGAEGAGGNGGFGGGGGGGSVVGGGNGGFGGGGGGDVGAGGGNGGFGAGSGSSSGGGGGGGGMGGAVFVAGGGTLVIGGQGSTAGSSASRGTGNNGAGNGQAFGNDIFIQGATTLTFAPGAGQTYTLTNDIADEAGNGGNPANKGAVAMTGAGTLVLTAASSFAGGTTASRGLINFNAANNFGSGTISLNGGGLQWATGNTTDISGRLAAFGSGGATFDTSGNNVTFANALSGAGGLTKAGNGTLALSTANAYTGGTTIAAGTLRLTGTGTLGAATGATTVSGGTLDLGGSTQTQSALTLSGGTIQNGGLNTSITSTGGTINGVGGTASLTTTSGTTIVTGTNTYSGATTVNGGVLDVVGSISDPTVNANGTLMGTGTVAATQVNAGGTFAPGNGTAGTSMSIAGNLAFASGAIYLVQVNPSTASFATVTGTATLGGATVNAVFANGSYVARQYTILTATGGVSGTFGALTNANLPPNFSDTLSYDPTHAYLNLTLNFSGPNFGSGLNINQQAVANALSGFFDATGGIPLAFGALTPAGLTQVSGELATGSQQATFDAMNMFVGLMTDPFVAGRSDGFGATGGAPTGYAATQSTGAARDANAMFVKAPVVPFEARWSVWSAGYGGSQTTDGNAIVGSNSTTSSVYGTAVGADYRISPNTLAGFALAGGGTNFSVAGSGSGHSDLFQAGAFIRHTIGPAYISAALAYGWQDITTNRTVTAAGSDQLQAKFDANAFSGRLEGGYRFVAPWVGGIGITPYAAAQFTTFDLPAYAESALSGASTFALAYNAKDVTDTRSELGVRADKSWALTDGILTLRGRLAWAHDYDPGRSIAATFQTLPGASFVVNGAAQASDSALVTASVEKKWLNGWSAAATFEGEFSDVTRSYAGKGVMRYQW